MKTLLIVIGLVAPSMVQAQQKDMSFFITSVGLGKGADLGGLKGADAHCQALAKAAGAGHRQWRAYLSTSDINARDRIGKGPWKNAKGEEIAKNVEDLHTNSKISKQTGLDEKGQPVNGRGDSPNRPDILTGSQPDGRALPADGTPRAATGPAAASRGCSQDALRSSGGDGLFYCFAVK